MGANNKIATKIEEISTLFFLITEFKFFLKIISKVRIRIGVKTLAELYVQTDKPNKSIEIIRCFASLKEEKKK